MVRQIERGELKLKAYPVDYRTPIGHSYCAYPLAARSVLLDQACSNGALHCTSVVFFHCTVYTYMSATYMNMYLLEVARQLVCKYNVSCIPKV